MFGEEIMEGDMDEWRRIVGEVVGRMEKVGDGWGGDGVVRVFKRMGNENDNENENENKNKNTNE